MPHRAIRAAIAAGLAATALTAPTNAPAPAAEPAAEPAAVEIAPAGVPAVTLLSGAAPTTVTPGDGPAGLPAAAAGLCDSTPCPPQQPEWTTPTTFAVVKNPHPSVDQHATPAGGPSAPALLLLDQIRPRSDLPAGRTTHLGPRPA